MSDHDHNPFACPSGSPGKSTCEYSQVHSHGYVCDYYCSGGRCLCVKRNEALHRAAMAAHDAEKQDAYDCGYHEGYSEGYDDGREDGELVGYEGGYTDGYAKARNHAQAGKQEAANDE